MNEITKNEYRLSLTRSNYDIFKFYYGHEGIPDENHCLDNLYKQECKSCEDYDQCKINYFLSLLSSFLYISMQDGSYKEPRKIITKFFYLLKNVKHENL